MLRQLKRETPVFAFEGEGKLWEKGIDAIVQMGSYPNREAILAESFALFLLTHPQLSLIMAINLYQSGAVTLARAAELANLNFFDFQAILRARGVPIMSPDETLAEIQQGVALILGES